MRVRKIIVSNNDLDFKKGQNGLNVQSVAWENILNKKQVWRANRFVF